MARKNENRVRSKTVSFYVTPLEHTELMARIKVSGMPKGEYFIQSFNLVRYYPHLQIRKLMARGRGYATYSRSYHKR